MSDDLRNVSDGLRNVGLGNSLFGTITAPQLPYVTSNQADRSTGVVIEEASNGYIVRLRGKVRICESIEQLGDTVLLLFQESKL